MTSRSGTFILVPSPFLGAFAWRAVAEVLRERSAECSVFDPGPAVLRSPDPYGAIAELCRRESSDNALWVAHSGAGGLVPMLISNSAERTAGVILVDALLPHPGAAWIETAPGRLASMISERARDGFAPPWPSWWGSRLADLLPNADDRAALIANPPAVPMKFLRTRAPQIDIPACTRVAYLRLSTAYEPECCAANARGWLVRRRDARHLMPITDPSKVADDLIELRDALSQRATVRDAV